MQIHFKAPCPICQHMMVKNRLEEHIAKHSSSPEFECNVGEKVYFSQKDLNKHFKRYHENNQFSLENHLTAHLKVSCPICSKLMIKKQLSRHMKYSHSSGQLN